MRGFFRLRLFLLCSLFALGISPSARAQSAISSGAISGQVTDPSGAAVPGVTVKLTNVSTGVEQTVTTNSAGLYRFPVVAVGTYTISLSKTGFRTVNIENAVVQVGQTAAENATLTVGSMTQSVTVAAAGPLLRPTDTTVSTVVNQTLIQGLPLSGRRYTDFVLLTPNATADGQFGLVSIGGQQGGQDYGYANGNGSNSFSVDGANDTSNYFGDARGRTRVPYIFGEEAIQEFQVADNPYNASYGGAGSGFINTVTKSGTDTWHGEAFYYNRNSGVGNANDAVDKSNGVPTPLNILQQFGANLGGPLVHRKLWFFFDYEQQRQKEPISVINAAYAGVGESDFQNVAPGTALPPPNGPFPVPASFSSAPSPGDPNYPIYLQQVSNALNAIQSNLGERKRFRNDLEFFPKIDWQPRTSDHLSFDYNYNKFDSPGGTFTFNPVASFGIEALPDNFVRDHHATIHWTHIFNPTLLNDFHASYLRDEQIGTPSEIINPDLPNVFLFARGFFALGNPTFSVADTKEFQWEFADQINWTHGRHSLQFGLDINRTHVTDFFPGNFLGTYGFFDLTDFALGNYGFFTQATGNPVFPFTFPYYAFYGQDKFQATKRLTLDFGLREDFQVYPQPRENPAVPLTGQFPNQYQRLSPRFGFAWQPLEKTVVRGGFGMFYQVLNGLNYENSVISNGLASQQVTAFERPSFSGAPTFPNILPANSPSFGPSSDVSIVDPGFKTPYILEASLEIQREVLPNTTVSIGTMWTHGVHLISSNASDLNLCPPQGIPGSAACLPVGTTTYIVCPPGAGADASHPVSTAVCTGPTFTGPTFDNGLLTEGRLNPNVGQINALISPALNNYNSFYVQVQRRAARGLNLMLSYTFSKNIVSNGADFFNQFDFSQTRAPSLLDQRHRLSIAAVYAPGAPNFPSGFVRGLLSDWTISTLMQFNSGRTYAGLLNSACTNSMAQPDGTVVTAPMDFTDCIGAGDNLNDSAFNQSTVNTAVGINGLGPSPGIGLNAFYGPWIDEIDLGIARDFHLTERQIITLKAQAFNLFNHPNFFVQEGRGINQTQYDPIGTTCGDGMSGNQTCFLVPDPGFKTLQSISELNGPRIFQFAFYYKF